MTISFQWIVDVDSAIHFREYVPPNSNPTYPPKTEKTRIQWMFDTDVTQYVGDFILPPNETFPPTHNKAGVEWTYSENDDDFAQWFNTFTSKVLILSNEGYKTFNKETSTWEIIEVYEYNKELFNDYGISISVLLDNLNLLDDEFTIVNWTDEIDDSKILNGNFTPKPQLVFTRNLHYNYGNLQNIISEDLTDIALENSNVRFLLSSDNINWQTWNSTGFEVISPSNYKTYGLTIDELSQIDLSLWVHPLINVGVYLEDNVDDTVISKVGKLEIQQLLPSVTPQLSNVSFYILNTTARIDVTLKETLLRATLSDDDLGRVQYRLFLNGQPYRHNETNEEGWNELTPSPYNINVKLYDELIIIPNDNNTLRIEFRDAFGTEDYWEGTFFAKKTKGKFTYAFVI